MKALKAMMLFLVFATPFLTILPGCSSDNAEERQDVRQDTRQGTRVEGRTEERMENRRD